MSEQSESEESTRDRGDEPIASDADPPADATGTSQEHPLADVLAERDAAVDRALRSQAELENYRRRVQRERDEERRYAALPLVRDLLPGLDNLQRALDAAQHTDDLSAMLQGVEMVAGQIAEILTRHGAEPIVAVGEPFDPNRHEAITQMPSSEHPPMTVIDEVERGYTLHDRVVRPSKVIVSVAPSE
ncbi:MAG: nucleotide exchange factor GrpE [Planctomycetaceae bacterium]